MTRREAKNYRAQIDTATAKLDDADALNAIELYQPWQSGIVVATGDRYRYDGKLYKCLQAHLTQDDWAPPDAPALWAAVSVDEYPEWVQPTGAHDAYNIGDKCTYQGKRYICTVDGNAYAPTVYGWQEVAE